MILELWLTRLSFFLLTFELVSLLERWILPILSVCDLLLMDQLSEILFPVPNNRLILSWCFSVNLVHLFSLLLVH